jgi:hypothetical protein
MVGPRFKHDCEHCSFLGHAGDHDHYYCSYSVGELSLIARFGDAGPEYSSMPIETVEAAEDQLRRDLPGCALLTTLDLYRLHEKRVDEAIMDLGYRS